MMHRLPRVVQRLGLPGALGLLAMGLAVYLQHDMARLQTDLDRAQQEADQVREGLRQASRDRQPSGSAEITPALTPTLAWQALWQRLPPATQRMTLQSQVWRSAQTLGLQLPSLQVQAQQETWVPTTADGHGLWRQRMQLPVEGPYYTVRAWVQALQHVPGLGIDGLDVQRADPRSDGVKAQVRLSLWWRGQEVRP